MEVIIDQVSKSFRNGKKVLPVLEDINITLHKEEFVALTDPFNACLPHTEEGREQNRFLTR